MDVDHVEGFRALQEWKSVHYKGKENNSKS